MIWILLSYSIKACLEMNQAKTKLPPHKLSCLGKLGLASSAAGIKMFPKTI